MVLFSVVTPIPREMVPDPDTECLQFGARSKVWYMKRGSVPDLRTKKLVPNQLLTILDNYFQICVVSNYSHDYDGLCPGALVILTTLVHELSKTFHNSIQGSQDGFQLLLDGGRGCLVGMKPLCEASEGSTSLVSVEGLFSGLESRLHEGLLIVASPDHFEISVDREGLRVGHVELVEPPCKTLATGVPVKRAGDALSVQPLVGLLRDVPAVLTIRSCPREPFSVNLEPVTLEVVDDLHGADGTAGVPVHWLHRVPLVVQLRHRWLLVVVWAGANPIDLPGSGSSLLTMKLATTANHVSPRITFVRIHVVRL